MVLTNQLIYLVNVKTMRNIFFQIMCASQKVRTLCESCKQCFKKDHLVNNPRAVNILLFCETALVQKDRKYVGVTICTKVYA